MLLLPIWCKHEVAMYNDSHRKPGTNSQGRLNVEVPTHHLLTGLIQGICGSQTQRLKNGRVGAGIGTGSQLRTDTEQCRKRGCSYEFFPMVVDLVLEARVPR